MISLRWGRRILPGGLLGLCGIIVGLLMAVPIVSPASAQSSRDVLRLFDSLQRSVPHYQAPRQRSRARQNREAVYRAQTMLNALGYNAGPEDGAMGPRTRGALTAFQRDRGLSRSGRPDAQTMAALQQAVRSRTASQPAPAPAPASPASQAPAPATEFVGYYEASSRTASAITGDITVAPETITFGNGATIGLRPVHQRGTFAVDPPADPELLQGTTLCGNGPPQFVVLAQNNPDFLGLSVFADRQDPVGQQLCAYYTYERGTTPPAAPGIAAAPGGAVIGGAATPATQAARTSFAPNSQGGPTISILGVTIAEPVSVEIPVEWHQVRDFVPDELLATPAEPLTQAQVGARVSAMRTERGADYERALDLLATVAAAANPGHGKDFIKLLLAEWSLSPPLPGEVIGDMRADVVISDQVVLRPETQALAKSLEIERLAREHAALSLIADEFGPAGMDPAAAPVAMQAQPTPGAAPADDRPSPPADPGTATAAAPTRSQAVEAQPGESAGRPRVAAARPIGPEITSMIDGLAFHDGRPRDHRQMTSAQAAFQNLLHLTLIGQRPQILDDRTRASTYGRMFLPQSRQEALFNHFGRWKGDDEFELARTFEWFQNEDAPRLVAVAPALPLPVVLYGHLTLMPYSAELGGFPVRESSHAFALRIGNREVNTKSLKR